MVIASKDEEIANYRQAIEDLRKQAAASQIDADKQIIVSLRRELQEKNEHVESLEKQLQDVSNEMKEITEQIENIKQQADKGQCMTARLDPSPPHPPTPPTPHPQHPLPGLEFP